MAEPLRIRFAADVDAAKRGMADLAASVASNALRMAAGLKAVNDNAQRMSATMAAIPSAAGNIAQVIAALLALKIAADVTGAAVKAAKDNLADLVKIGNDARSAGVGTNFLQAWTLQARELGTEAGKLEGMLLRAREAATIRIGEGGKGASSDILDRLGEHLKAGNVSQADLDRYTGAKDQEARIRVILDLIDQLRAKGAQLAAFDIANKFFGPDFEKQLRNGVDMVGKMRDALNGMSVAGGERIFTEEEAERARRINAQLVLIDNLMSEGLAPIQRDLIALGQRQYESWLDIKQMIAGAVSWAGQLYERVKSVLDALDKFTGSNPLATLANKLGAGAAGDALGRPLKPLADWLTPGQAPPAPLPIEVNAKRDASRSLPGKDKAAGSETDAVETYIQALERSTAALKAEVEAYGKSNAEKERAIALAKAEELAKQRGTALTDEERQKIEALSTAAGQAKDKMAALQQQSQQTAEAIRTIGQAGVDALADLIDKSRTADQVLRDLAKQLLRWSLQATFLGTGPLAGMMGTSPSPNGVGAASVGGIFGAMAQAMGGLLRTGTPAGTAATAAAPASTPGIDALARTILGGLGVGMGNAGSAPQGTASPLRTPDLSPAADASSGTGGAAALANLFGLPLRNITMPSRTPGVPVSGSLDPTDDRYKALQAGLEAKAEEMAKAGDRMTEAVQETADGVGASGSDLINSLASLGSGLAKSIVTGAGGMATAIPGFADGTDYAPGGLSIVGERGPELMRVPRGAAITPNHKLAGLFAPKTSGGSGSTGTAGARVSAPVTINQTITGNGDATIAQIARRAVEGGLSQYDRHLQRNLGGMISEWNRRVGRM